MGPGEPGRAAILRPSKIYQTGPGYFPGELRIGVSVLKAVLAHLYIAWIHPFGDGNGRTARLLEFRILLSNGVPAPAAHLLSNHYNKTREEYYRQLDAASKSGGNIIPFVLYAVQGFRDGLREQIQYIQNQQFDIIWRNYVHELFRDKTSPADQRRRRLILDLSKKNEPVPRHLLTTISPKVAHAYAQKTDRTLTRDLRELRKLGLIVRKIKGYVAKTEIIRAFLAPRHDASADAALENRITKRREIREAKSLQNKELQRS
jgi:Fic family protein